MTGYQEILTDPSYCQQIVTLTYPHIGNYGINAEDIEADKVHAAGLIIKDLPLLASNFRSTETLSQYLVSARSTVAIANIDTRQLTRHAAHQGRAERLHRGAGRRRGRDPGRASTRPSPPPRPRPAWPAWIWPRWCRSTQPYDWTQTEWQLGSGYGEQTAPKFHVVAYDFGVKKNILRMLAERGCKVTVVPAQTPAAEVLKLKPDGIFLVQRPRRPGALRLRDRRRARTDRDRHPDLRHLPGPPDHGAGLAAPRPSR